LRNSGLFCCALSVWTDDLKRVLKRHGLRVDPYSFTLYQIVVSVGTMALNNHPNDPSFHLVLDRVEQGTKKIAEAERLYETDTFASWRGWPAVTALKPKDREGAREILELQAADFVAWLIRNQLNNIQWWMRNVKPTIGQNKMEQWSDSLAEWLSGRTAELRQTFPEAALFTDVWGSLQHWKILKHYPYDEERLENHVFYGRQLECDPELKARTIQTAGGPFPLTP
jgi:hypothetical protein